MRLGFCCLYWVKFSVHRKRKIFKVLQKWNRKITCHKLHGRPNQLKLLWYSKKSINSGKKVFSRSRLLQSWPFFVPVVNLAFFHVHHHVNSPLEHDIFVWSCSHSLLISVRSRWLNCLVCINYFKDVVISF